MNLINVIIKILLFLLAVVAVMMLSTSMFIGAGYLISLMLPLTFFESTVLSLGACFVFGFLIIGAVFLVQFNRFAKTFEDMDEFGDWDDDDDHEDDDDWDDEDWNDPPAARPASTPEKKVTIINKDKIGRNQSCPCGSGKKYKHCCGRKA